MSSSRQNQKLTAQIATLANLPLSADQLKKTAAGFAASVALADQLLAIKTAHVAPTYQVNDLENAWREDTVNEYIQLTQTQALANAARVHQGYFVVGRVIDNEA